ncbi:S41 family peptidase [Paramuribaculum intestinale]|uniref:S41 family peptidase n=1 Tax=Paramuribaculum intestinale TaxID=2094151 RepID=UPI0025AA2714|nr:S41 family peptidase [Paramuribaculum intestinale]
MRKIITAIMGAALPFAIAAQEADINAITVRLDSLYNAVLTAPGAETCKVRYTGSDGTKAPGGFLWQRGLGKGWTQGLRISLPDVSQNKAAEFDNFFQKIGRDNFVIRYNDHCSATLIEPLNTIYVYDYDSADSRLSFMKATTTGEICVPKVWTHCDSLDATKHDPLAFASRRELALLGLSRLWSGVRRNFAFMKRVRLDWDSLYVANMEPVADASHNGDDERVGELLQLMAARLGDGHTFVYGYDRNKCYTPLSTVILDGRVYADEVLSPTLEEQGIKHGMELVSVNGIPVAEYGYTHVMPYISSSTPQWSEHTAFNGYNLLATKKGETMRMTFRDGKTNLDAEYTPDGKFWPSSPRAIEFSLLKDKVGLLRINNFMDADFCQQFDNIYPSILKTRALIIDLRGNEGGNSGNGDYILRHLTSDTIKTGQWTSPAYIPAFASWGMDQPVHQGAGNTLPPFTDRPVFDRPAAILVDGGTFSAAEDFTAAFRGMGRGMIVGTPTAGSTGNGVQIVLIPGVAYANICSKHDVAPDGTEFVGTGIKPDIEIRENYDSYFGTAGSPVIKAALRLLK